MPNHFRPVLRQAHEDMLNSCVQWVIMSYMYKDNSHYNASRDIS
jgi:hypothetical protein